MHIAQAFAAFSRRYSVQTTKQYTHELHQFMRWATHVPRTKKACEQLVHAYLQQLHEHGVHSSAYNRAFGALKAAHEQRLLSGFPLDLKLKKRHASMLKPVPMKWLSRLMEAADDESLHAMRNVLIIGLIGGLGLRLQEIKVIQTEDWDGKRLVVSGDFSRVICPDVTFADWLTHMKRWRNGLKNTSAYWVYGKTDLPISTAQVTRLIKRVGERANISCTSETIRKWHLQEQLTDRTALTDWIQLTGRKQMGHADLARLSSNDQTEPNES